MSCRHPMNYDLALSGNSLQQGRNCWQRGLSWGRDFLGEDDIAWLTRFRDLHLSEDEAKALIVVREAGATDNATYRELSKMDALAASQALRRLRDAGLLAQKGRGSATYYVPTERLIADETSLSSKSGEGLSSKPGALSSKPPTLSSNPAALPDEPETLSTRYDETQRSQLLDTLPGSLAARLGAIGLRHPPRKPGNSSWPYALPAFNHLHPFSFCKHASSRFCVTLKNECFRMISGNDLGMDGCLVGGYGASYMQRNVISGWQACRAVRWCPQKCGVRPVVSGRI